MQSQAAMDYRSPPEVAYGPDEAEFGYRLAAVVGRGYATNRRCPDPRSVYRVGAACVVACVMVGKWRRLGGREGRAHEPEPVCLPGEGQPSVKHALTRTNSSTSGRRRLQGTHPSTPGKRPVVEKDADEEKGSHP